VLKSGKLLLRVHQLQKLLATGARLHPFVPLHDKDGEIFGMISSYSGSLCGTHMRAHTLQSGYRHMRETPNVADGAETLWRASLELIFWLILLAAFTGANDGVFSVDQRQLSFWR
jgi:hypothetical protein